MPDKWEYPWYAAWDLAFHCVPLALVDPDFAKEQLELLLQNSFLHPSGQIPAYEWNFSDVNPPVHAWAAHRVFKIEKKMGLKAYESTSFTLSDCRVPAANLLGGQAKELLNGCGADLLQGPQEPEHGILKHIARLRPAADVGKAAQHLAGQ